jgi:peptidoglycan hydrolase-like protein with peptidoglycan-binding domain
MALQRKQMPSPNYSSRGGSNVRLVVIHTAEGSTTIESLGNFFASSSSGVSSHTGADDKAGIVGEYVRPDYKAWTAANANPVAVQIELCAFAAWTTDQWHQHPNILSNCAAWVQEECARFGIPIVKLTASQAQGSSRGVCQHRDLGSWGGNHSDAGNGFPIDEVLSMASGGAPIAPGPTPPTPPSGGAAPPFPGTMLVNFTQGHGTATWQQQMANRGWALAVDDLYGGESEQVCRQFQSEKGLDADGVVGPLTWDATWTAPVT